MFIFMGMIKKCVSLFLEARDSVGPYAKCNIFLRRMPYILVLLEKWLCCFVISYI